MVDFKKLKAQHAKEKDASSGRIFAILLAPRGKGKSGTAAGTWKNRRVLQLAYLQEDHGIASAGGISSADSDITPLLLDVVDGEKLSPEAAYDRTLEVLRQADISQQFDVLVLDGLSALDCIIASHPKVKAADNYSVTRVTNELFDPVLTALKELGLKGLDVVITCSTSQQADGSGAYESPSLRGRVAAETFIGACSEILHLATVEKEDGTAVFAFVFDTEIRKSGTKMNKEKYSIPIGPRITGIPKQMFPTAFRADMAALKEWKVKKLAEVKSGKEAPSGDKK